MEISDANNKFIGSLPDSGLDKDAAEAIVSAVMTGTPEEAHAFMDNLPKGEVGDLLRETAANMQNVTAGLNSDLFLR